jgi:hypothetical protein
VDAGIFLGALALLLAGHIIPNWIAKCYDFTLMENATLLGL